MPASLSVNALLATDFQKSALSKKRAGSHATHSYMSFGYGNFEGFPIIGFAGQPVEANTNLYLLGSGVRPYSTSLMRFTAADELSPFDQGGLNSYAYCSGDPVNLVDPGGHVSLKLFTGLLSVAGLATAGSGAVLQFGNDNEIGVPLIIVGGLMTFLGVPTFLAPSRASHRPTIHARRRAEFRRMFEQGSTSFSRPAPRSMPSTGSTGTSTGSARTAHERFARYQQRSVPPRQPAPSTTQALRMDEEWVTRLKPQLQDHARHLLSRTRTPEDERALRILRARALETSV